MSTAVVASLRLIRRRHRRSAAGTPSASAAGPSGGRRATTTPRHVPAKVVQVQDIPRTKSGKIVELAVRNVVHGQAVKNVEALANPEALEFFRERPEASCPRPHGRAASGPQ